MRKPRSLEFYKVDFSQRGWIGIQGKAVSFLSGDYEDDSELVQAVTYRGSGDPVMQVKMFNRHFVARLIDNRFKTKSDRKLKLRLAEGSEIIELPWKLTKQKRFKHPMQPQQFTKRNVIRAVIRNVLEPEKEKTGQRSNVANHVLG